MRENSGEKDFILPQASSCHKKSMQVVKKKRVECTLLFFYICILVTACSPSDLLEKDRQANSLQTEISTEANHELINQLDLNDIPVFSNQPYVEVNGNHPFFTEAEKKNINAFEEYSDLDALGRCGPAYANVCKELQPTEERGPIGDVKPSGWHTVKYNGLVDGNYLYNRCHLLGYQLTGENANEKNLITGTRYLNVMGMLPFENKVYEYVTQTNHHVLYRVTPLFKGDNLVADGVEMEAWSVEDGGKGICFHVFCYNVQPGIIIDYATGESRLDEAYVAEKATQGQESGNNEQVYIVNKNTKKFHLPSSSSVSDMKEHNKWKYEGTLESLIEMGYTPCEKGLK